eukprot:gene19124-21041_t
MAADEDDIDFKKLARELDAAVQADSKYSRENAAKFRAVEQKVGSYEEFRDIVLASNLKPLDRKDITGETKRHQPLNSLCSSKQANDKDGADKTIKENMKDNKDMFSQPQSADEFIKTWKKSPNDRALMYKYMMHIRNDLLNKVFASQHIGNILGEVLTVLNEHFADNDVTRIIDIMKSLQSSKRLSLSITFLTKSEKSCLVELFDQMWKTSEDADKDTISELKKTFLL